MPYKDECKVVFKILIEGALNEVNTYLDFFKEEKSYWYLNKLPSRKINAVKCTIYFNFVAYNSISIFKKTLSEKYQNVGMNPIIIGWSNYHRSVVSAEVFSNRDHRMWNMLWRWAKRRHPDKSRTWVVKKYWHSERNWVFSTERNRLKRFSDTKIARHTSLNIKRFPLYKFALGIVPRCTKNSTGFSNAF